MKFTLSIPGPTFKAGERLAKQMGLSRSQLYTDALRAYLRKQGSAAITEKLNAVHAAISSKLDPAFTIAHRAILLDEAW